LIRGGRVVDPASGRDEVADLLVRDGRIAEIGRIGSVAGAEGFDAAGCVVAPGLIDLHVHLRVPGQEHKETIATGTAAAAAGGFTTICCMPNTIPALDSAETLNDLKSRVAREAQVRVQPIAAISKGRKGEESVDYAALVEAGAIGFSDDGDTTVDSRIMRQALEASRDHGRPVMVHCEDRWLASGGAMHEGDVSDDLGICGIPAEAEEIVIARDLMLAQLTGGWLHVLHVSTGRGADLTRQAKAEGVHVTAEVMPHHLLMIDAWVAGDRTLLNTDERTSLLGRPADPNTKVNPPLRTAEDTRQLLAALTEGVFDIIATDHAPHARAEKDERDFASAAFGMNGLEFALPLMLALVRAGHLSLSDVIRLMSSEPARMLSRMASSDAVQAVGAEANPAGLTAPNVVSSLGSPGTLAPGSRADLIVFDPEERWTVAPDALKSKSANTPLLGMELRGKVKLTLVDGQERHRG
jgi:dihydroorotase